MVRRCVAEFSLTMSECVFVLPVVYLEPSLCELSWQSLLPTGSVFLLQQAAVQAAFPFLLCCHGLEAMTVKHTDSHSLSNKSDPPQSLQDSFLYLLIQLFNVCVCVCLSTWKCSSDSRVCSSSSSLFWLNWIRFLTWNQGNNAAYYWYHHTKYYYKYDIVH